MKRCPTCQRTYPDDAPAFCVNDGVQLVTEAPQSYDPQKTMLASAPPPPPQYANPQPPPPPSPPQQPFQAQNQMAGIKPPTAWPQPGEQPQQAPWPPPPQQAQNWGGYNQQPGQQPGQYPGYAPQYGAPAAATGGKGLSLASFILGIISLLALSLIFLMTERVIDPDRDVAAVCFWGSAITGLAAVVLGALALISRKQRNKWMAILGLVLGLPAILFFFYALINYGL